MMDKLATIVRNALEQPAVIDTAATCMTSNYPTSFIVHLTRDGVQIGQPVEPNLNMYRKMQVKMTSSVD